MMGCEFILRRVTIHKGLSYDREELQIITVWEEGISRKQIKNFNKFTKKHALLARRGKGYKYVGN
jgi:hypothetical protein